MEFTCREVTNTIKRHRLWFVFILLCTWIISLYLLRGTGITSKLYRHVSRLHFLNNISMRDYTSTIAELDHTIGIIRYKNCLVEYDHDFTKCKNYDRCNRYSNSSRSVGCEKRLPGCLVIGVYKAGTRALVDFLSMNPRVVVRTHPYYELQFFDKHSHMGTEWYRNEMPFSMPDQITIEKSPSYFQSEKAPSRIAAMNPEMKLILLVRNPLDRAISHFTFESYVSNNHYGGLMRNCILDPWSGKVNKNCFAIKYSTYDEAMERYLEYFSEDNILIIEYEEFINDPFAVLQKVESFLHLDPVIQQTDFVYNEKKGYFCLREDKKSKVASCYDPTRGRDISEKRYRDMGIPLRDYFKQHNEKFFQMIGRTFSWNSPLTLENTP